VVVYVVQQPDENEKVLSDLFSIIINDNQLMIG